MTEDRRTKAQLLAEIEQLKGYAEIAKEKTDRPVMVPEADALAGCVRAINALPRIKSGNSSVTWTYVSNGQYGYDSGSIDRGSIRRILLHLADKYGVPLSPSADTAEEA